MAEDAFGEGRDFLAGQKGEAAGEGKPAQAANRTAAPVGARVVAEGGVQLGPKAQSDGRLVAPHHAARGVAGEVGLRQVPGAGQGYDFGRHGALSGPNPGGSQGL